MINTTTNYIVYTSGHRHHHAGTQTQLIPATNGKASPGDILPVTAFASLPYMGQNLPLAFMSVVGAADGSHLYTSPGTQNIQVGNSDIKILIVYAPVGGIGTGDGYGVWVDAFNVDIGDFSDSDFMSVYTNGQLDPAASSEANDQGVVSSDTTEDMRSYNTVDGVPLLQWQKIGAQTITSFDYDLQVHEGGMVFAFYQTPPTQTPPRYQGTVGAQAGWVYVSPGVLVDGGGFVIGSDGKPHPVDPWGPLVAKLLTTVTILSAATNMTAQVKAEAMALAANHLASIAQSVRSMEIGE